MRAMTVLDIYKELGINPQISSEFLAYIDELQVRIHDDEDDYENSFSRGADDEGFKSQVITIYDFEGFIIAEMPLTEFFDLECTEATRKDWLEDKEVYNLRRNIAFIERL